MKMAGHTNQTRVIELIIQKRYPSTAPSMYNRRLSIMDATSSDYVMHHIFRSINFMQLSWQQLVTQTLHLGHKIAAQKES